MRPPSKPADPGGARELNPFARFRADRREIVDMSSTRAVLQQRKERLDEELKQVEKQVYDLETTYLNESSQYGNVLKGFEGFPSQTKNTSQKKARNFKPEDRRFRSSSSPRWTRSPPSARRRRPSPHRAGARLEAGPRTDETMKASGRTTDETILDARRAAFYHQ